MGYSVFSPDVDLTVCVIRFVNAAKIVALCIFCLINMRVVEKMLLRSKSKQAKSAEDSSDNSAFPLLDLPELVLESIIRRLSPYHLCQLAQTSKDLRKRCRNDEIWETLYNERWGKVAGMNAFALWRRTLFRRNAKIWERPTSLWLRPLKCIWYFTRSELTTAEPVMKPNEAFVNLYWQLECGDFWFPAQVFNREHGHAGFMLSCYDADLNYDRNSDTFCARYLPHSAKSLVIEDGISWERIRKPPDMTSPSELYFPDVQEELRPGDHIEVQWKKSPSFPYGWWYGIVGHDDYCRSETQNCRCHLDEKVWLEFRQYATGSRWRRIQMRRNKAPEAGSESDGFYGGIRKLKNRDDISAWLQIWPKEPLK
ncbi:F-box protein At2g26850 isoform X2 [Cryptomeria japonica]|uniref:F-box protein At2g26850 isoform X2 n=1 Tax=Cryptomeria japonica TaxID=3369 RepID=UPI0025ACAE1B|nr:F-box protein At2g26850 isoform X2 [Cryptomeria japonica]